MYTQLTVMRTTRSNQYEIVLTYAYASNTSSLWHLLLLLLPPPILLVLYRHHRHLLLLPLQHRLPDSGSSPLSFSLSELSLPEVEARLHASVEAEDLFPSRLIPQPAAVETETTDGTDRRCFGFGGE